MGDYIMPQIIRNLNGRKSETFRTRDIKKPEDILYVLTKEDRNFLDYLKEYHKKDYLNYFSEINKD